MAERVQFEYNNNKYYVTKTEDWSLDVLESYENNKIATATKKLLGDEQYKKFKDTNPTIKDLNKLFSKIQEVLGMKENLKDISG